MANSYDVDSVLTGCIEAFRRCEIVADAASEIYFSTRSLGGQTIGSHMRHCLDHLLCFLRGIETGAMDYDQRDRNPIIESNARAFRVALAAAMERLQAINPTALTTVVSVRQSPASGVHAVAMQSTVGRELMFLSHHTIHHVAMAMHLAESLKLSISPELSLAYSTAAHRAAVGDA
ncbi:MAG: hypothetical protein AMXMBFR84_31900 [Candidatus Hydrogenedentota bacterium]